MARRITDADITFLSLCPRGKNGLRTIFKDDGAFESPLVSKGMDEKGQIVACAYPPNRLDAEDDWCAREDIEKLAHGFLRNGGKIDLMHDGRALSKEEAHVAESFVIQPGDPRFDGVKDYAGRAVDVTGGWGVVVQVNSPALRKAYREGTWAGVSMFGRAAVRAEDLRKMSGDEVVAALKSIFTATSRKETETMSDAEINALVNKAVTDGMKSALPEALKAIDAAKVEQAQKDAAAEAAKGPKLPKDLDVTDPAKVEEFLQRQEVSDLASKVDWAKPESIREYQTKLAALKKAREDAAAKAKGGKAPAKPAASAQDKNLAKGAAEAGAETEGGEDGDEALVKKGLTLAQFINQQNGTSAPAAK